MTDANQTFVREISEKIPRLKVMFQEHLRDNSNEVLPHLFLGDLTRLVVELSREASSRGGIEVSRELHAILNELEAAFASRNEDLMELISVSFLENLPYPGEPGSEVRSLLSKEMAAELRRIQLM